MIPEPEVSKTIIIQWSFRLIATALVSVTVHYIGFFSTLTENYFILMSPSLLARVTWSLTSALAMASLYLSVLYLILGLLKGSAYGVLSMSNMSKDIREPSYRIEPERIIGPYLAVLGVTYFPIDASLTQRTVYLVMAFIAIFLLYVVFARKFDEQSNAMKLFKPLRKPELLVRALIATSLAMSYFMGAGLARSILSETPTKIETSNGNITATIIDSTDAGILVSENGDVYFIPMHAINKISWNGASKGKKDAGQN